MDVLAGHGWNLASQPQLMILLAAARPASPLTPAPTRDGGDSEIGGVISSIASLFFGPARILEKLAGKGLTWARV